MSGDTGTGARRVGRTLGDTGPTSVSGLPYAAVQTVTADVVAKRSRP